MDIKENKKSETKQTLFLILGIFLISLFIIGGTYAYMTLGIDINNNVIAYNTTCFDIVYDADNDSTPITGTLIPSSGPGGGLNGKISLGLAANCINLDAYGSFYLNVTSGSDVLFQIVDGHCENSQTLRTLTKYTDQESCEAQTNGKWVTNGTALKYAVYTTNNITTTTVPLNVGYINRIGTTIIYDNFPVVNQTVNYYVYVWLDGNLSDDTYALQSFAGDISASASQVAAVSPDPNAPVLDDGMIPITISEDGVATTVSETDGTWYNYSNREWANVVLVKESGTQTREYYQSNTGVTVSEDDILAYYVWIPRYKYKIWTLTNSATGSEQTIDIVFEEASAQATEGSVVGDYITHPAFIWDGNTIAGFWVGKFETSHSSLASSTTSDNLGCTNENCTNADGIIIKPNVKSLRYNNVSNEFYASRSMTRSSNPFGLSSSTTDSHMMKNSEWGAVAYLSHSQYGINQEIYINNSGEFYTGRSGGNVGGSVNTLATQFPDSSTSTNQYNSYGYYTWTGQEISSSGTIGSYASDRMLGTNASTTGNVTGVYDMSGGSNEYVMGYYSGANSNYATDTSYFGWTSSANSAGFISDVSSKYWDNYTTTSNTTACNSGVCLGHALNEITGWYSDAGRFVGATSPWLRRGGNFSGGATAGAWNFYNINGIANSIGSFRSIAIVGA